MPPPVPPPPPVLWVPSDRAWFDPQLIGRNLVVVTTDFVVDPVTPRVVAPANPMRWAVGFSKAPPGFDGAEVGPWSDLTTGIGTVIPGDGMLWYHLTVYASLVQVAWYAVGGADATIRVTEILRQ